MIRHLAGFGEVVDDVEEAAAFYRGLGLEVKVENGYGSVAVPGVMHFGLWSRADCAEATYGSRDAVDRVSTGFRIGFEVDSVDDAEAAFEGRIVHGPKDEPWGQRTLRYVSPSGVVCEVAETPWARELETNVSAKGADVNA